MAHISSEIQDIPPKDESTGSETSIRSLYDYTLTGGWEEEFKGRVEGFLAF